MYLKLRATPPKAFVRRRIRSFKRRAGGVKKNLRYQYPRRFHSYPARP